MTHTSTRHAATRMQRRALSQLQIDLLMQFGHTEPMGHGVARVYFDKSSRRQLRAYAGSLALAIEAHLDIYAVVADEGQLITVAHCIQRVRHH